MSALIQSILQSQNGNNFLQLNQQRHIYSGFIVFKFLIQVNSNSFSALGFISWKYKMYFRAVTHKACEKTKTKNH